MITYSVVAGYDEPLPENHRIGRWKCRGGGFEHAPKGDGEGWCCNCLVWRGCAVAVRAGALVRVRDGKGRGKRTFRGSMSAGSCLGTCEAGDEIIVSRSCVAVFIRVVFVLAQSVFGEGVQLDASLYN
jgi:hypothetical protein